MFDLPPFAGAKRDAAILAHIRAGDFSVALSSVKSSIPGHTATFRVFSDALKIGGIRISCSATLLQQIADLTNTILLTPRLSDLAYTQAQTPIPPIPISPPSSDTATMVKESHLIDQMLNGMPAPHGLVWPIGKPWCLTNGLLTHPGRACLYGWQSAAPIPNVPLFSGTMSGIKVIQPISFAHSPDYVDYAQMCVLASQDCIVDNELTSLARVLSTPELAPLASHEGVVRVTRQPGVPQLAPLPPVTLPGGLQNVGLVTSSGPPTSNFLMLGLGLLGAAAGVLGGMAFFSRPNPLEPGDLTVIERRALACLSRYDGSTSRDLFDRCRVVFRSLKEAILTIGELRRLGLVDSRQPGRYFVTAAGRAAL